MRYERRLRLQDDPDQVREALRAYYLGEDYREARADERGFVFERAGGRLSRFGSRVENLPTLVTVRLGALSSSESEAVSCLVIFDYDIAAKWRLVTRIDYLFFKLEVDGFSHYLDTGFRRSPSQRLAPVRSPVAAAVGLNAAVSTVLVASVGILAGFHPGVTIAVAAVVALVNLVSILGFADIVIEGMESLVE